MATKDDISKLQRRVWEGSLPLEIKLSASECRTYDRSDPYLVQYHRLAYLPFLLPRLHAFFSCSLIDSKASPLHNGWFSFENVPLKWHFPVGLLYDLFSGAEPIDSPGGTVNRLSQTDNDDDSGSKKEDNTLPWRITVHFSDYPAEQLIRLDAEGKVIQDAFINGVKEADFLRNGTAKAVMSLSKDDSTALWRAVEQHDLVLFNSVNSKLLNPQGVAALRHIPIKVYLPTMSTGPEAAAAAAPATAASAFTNEPSAASPPSAGSLRIVQDLITPSVSAREDRTLGAALNALLPTVFPSRRRPILAQPVLHGAVVPMGAVLKDLLRAAAYQDGWLHVAVHFTA